MEKSEQEIAVLRKKAKEILPGRVAYFSRLTGLTPTGMSITSAKTRFGSCSGKNRVSFSLYLMQYSAGAVDYVVLHELCHIRHKNHGKEFYALIARYMPDYQKYVKELRK
jgi:predicted metal-dependent hydrolase